MLKKRMKKIGLLVVIGLCIAPSALAVSTGEKDKLSEVNPNSIACKHSLDSNKPESSSVPASGSSGKASSAEVVRTE